MKKIILTVATFLTLITGFSQNNVTIFSEDGLPFYLILNGIRQNENAETNIRLEKLSQEMFTAKIIFADQSIPSIDKKYFMVASNDCRPCDITYKIKTNKKGEVVLKIFTLNSIQTAPPTPQNVTIINYNTTPLPDIIFGSNISVTETTTTTHTNGGNGNNVNMGVNLGGFGVDVNINDGYSEHSHTTTTTSTTNYTTKPLYTETASNCLMNNSNFQSLINSIESKSFEDDKLIVAKQATSSNCLTAKQITQVMHLFSYEGSKLEYAKFAYNYCDDKNNYWQVNDAFDFDSSVEELNNSIK